jgi:hypothetical protein
MKLITVVLGMVVIAVAVVGAAQIQSERTISVNTARRMATKALIALGPDVAYKRRLDPRPDTYPPEFYLFEAVRHTEKTGFGVASIYYLAVNPWTGDVWDIGRCTRITSPDLSKEKDSIRKFLDLTVDGQITLSKRTPVGC